MVTGNVRYNSIRVKEGNVSIILNDGATLTAYIEVWNNWTLNIYGETAAGTGKLVAVSEDYVEIRHFTIIDEAHYMLSFDNRPLRNLIAVGRNKGLSIILATQNMDDFKSKSFDFYANAQYPLIMKQQSISDGVLKDLFGVSGKEFLDLKAAIAALQKGELIIKDSTSSILGIGNKWKKIKVTHLI